MRTKSVLITQGTAFPTQSSKTAARLTEPVGGLKRRCRRIRTKSDNQLKLESGQQKKRKEKNQTKNLTSLNENFFFNSQV